MPELSRSGSRANPQRSDTTQTILPSLSARRAKDSIRQGNLQSAADRRGKAPVGGNQIGTADAGVAMDKLTLARRDAPGMKIELVRWQVTLRGFFGYTQTMLDMHRTPALYSVWCQSVANCVSQESSKVRTCP
jgi:hypothetical protein